MRNVEFCYWLQGYFELRQVPVEMSESQFCIIRQHIALVKEVEGKLLGFPAWLEGVLDVVARDQNSAISQKIKDRLGQELLT